VKMLRLSPPLKGRGWGWGLYLLHRKSIHPHVSYVPLNLLITNGVYKPVARTYTCTYTHTHTRILPQSSPSLFIDPGPGKGKRKPLISLLT
jgi:hypothetical protein